MGINLLTMRNDIRSRVNDEKGDLTNPLLTQWINISQNVVYNQLLPVLSAHPALTGRVKIDIQSGVNEYPIPTDCRQIRRVRINGKRAQEKGIDDIDITISNALIAGENDPAFLSWAGKIEFFPVPSAPSTGGLIIDYQKHVVPLINDTDISILPPEYHGLIIEQAIKYALLRIGGQSMAVNSETLISKMVNDILLANAQQLAVRETRAEVKQ